MSEEPRADWDNVLDLLAQWHSEQRPEVGRAAVRFIESELRLMVPALTHRSPSWDLVEDALAETLKRLIERRLPSQVTDLRAYLARVFRNRCIDGCRARKRETSLESGVPEWESPEDVSASPFHAVLRDEGRARMQAALAHLSLVDRVVLKLESAPEWLTDEEVAWLAERTASTPAAVREAIGAAPDMHALTRIFDSRDDDLDDPKVRRKRMERFRRRRDRAREKLRAFLVEDEA